MMTSQYALKCVNNVIFTFNNVTSRGIKVIIFAVFPLYYILESTSNGKIRKKIGKEKYIKN